jgi:hypothetical protein
MRKLNMSSITTSVAMPVKSGSLEHIQNAYTEAIAESIKGLTGAGYSPATMYILNGMVNSGTFPTYNITAGSVFYNGEIYLVDAATFTLTGPQVAVCKIITTQFSGTNADAVQFTDGIGRNVHDIRKVQLSADLAGSGISNYVDGQRINSNRPDVNIIAGAGIGVAGAYPNITVTNTSLNTPEILKKGQTFIGDLNSSVALDAYTVLLAGSSNTLSAYRYTYPAALPPGTTNYFPLAWIGNGGHVDIGGFSNNSMCVMQMGGYDETGFYFAISTSNGGATQAINVYFILVTV